MRKRKLKRKRKLTYSQLLPLFVIAVSIVFSLVFTVLLSPIAAIDVKLIFILLLVVTTTVASAVALVFYLLLKKEIK